MSFFDRHDASYRAEVDFLAALLTGTVAPEDFPSTPEACVLTARLVELAERSAAQGGKRLPFTISDNNDVDLATTATATTLKPKL
jgi:hypothetical protein